MKTLITIAIAGLVSSTAFADSDNQTCRQKLTQIDQQLSYAHQYNNTNQIQGLETARAQVSAHCSDSQLEGRRQDNIGKLEEKLQNREDDLQKAQQEGARQSKIADRQRKVDEAHADLERALIGTHN